MRDSNRNGEEWETAKRWLSEYTQTEVDFLPDAIAGALRPNLATTDWVPIPGFEVIDDPEIWEFIRARLPQDLSGDVVLVSDMCFFEGGHPLVVPSDEVRELASSFVERHGDGMFSGDCIVIHRDLLILVHHEGLLCISTKRE